MQISSDFGSTLNFEGFSCIAQGIFSSFDFYHRESSHIYFLMNRKSVKKALCLNECDSLCSVPGTLFLEIHGIIVSNSSRYFLIGFSQFKFSDG